MKQLIKANLILILLTVAFFSNAYGQKANFNEIRSKKVKGRIIEYVTENGAVFRVGDTIKIGYPFKNNAFAHIQSSTTRALSMIGGVPAPPLNTNSTGQIGVIKKMVGMGRMLNVTTYGEGESMALKISNFEEAFNTGEILLPNYMTSDEALTSLKKAKDKLDLGLITQDEYDKDKAELSTFIK